MQDKYLTSHVTAYTCAVEEQEIGTKYFINKRQSNEGKTPTISNKCRLCKTNIEDITASLVYALLCQSRYYLLLRHDPVAKAVYLEHTKKNANTEVKFKNDIEFIEKVEDYEYWWNVLIKTSTKLPYNKPDILIWSKKTKTCSVIEISRPADVNMTQKTNEKLQKYAPLLANLQMIYNDYKFEMIPIIIGAFGFVPNDLKTSLGNLNFDKKETKSLIRKLQTITISAIVKIVKTFIRSFFFFKKKIGIHSMQG